MVFFSYNGCRVSEVLVRGYNLQVPNVLGGSSVCLLVLVFCPYLFCVSVLLAFFFAVFRECVCGQRLIDQCVDIELGFEVPRTISFHFGVRVVVAGFACRRRYVLCPAVGYGILWVAIVSVVLIVGEAFGAVLEQSVPRFAVHRWCSWPERPRACGSTSRTVQCRGQQEAPQLHRGLSDAAGRGGVQLTTSSCDCCSQDEKLACAEIVELLEWMNVSSANTFIIEERGRGSGGSLQRCLVFASLRREPRRLHGNGQRSVA